MRMKKFFPKDILIILFLVIFLDIVRILLFNSKSLVWLFWNIFLAIIPFFISSLMLWLKEKQKLKNIFLASGGFLWLLFIPNAPYLITDLIHVGAIRSVPVVYDAFLLFGASWLGMYLWLNSTWQIESIIREKISKINTQVAMFLIILATSFGIYLGRFLRLNSWDIFSDSTYFLKILHQKLIIKNDPKAYLYIVLFTFFLYTFYLAFRYRKEK